MAVKIRMKKMGRTHRPFFRLCAMDSRSPRDGRVIEELGTYDPMVRETDARAILVGERIDYWLSVGAQPTPKAAVLIKKYGTEGTHLDEQQQALNRLAQRKSNAIASATEQAAKAAANKPVVKEEAPAATEEASAESASEESAETATAETSTEPAAAEAATEDAAKADEKSEDEKKAEGE